MVCFLFRVNFGYGDTIVGAITANRSYEASIKLPTIIAAAEHSVMTAWGRDGEVDATR